MVSATPQPDGVKGANVRRDPVLRAHLESFYAWMQGAEGSAFPAWHEPTSEVELRGKVPAGWLLEQLTEASDRPARDSVCASVRLEPGATLAEVIGTIRAYWCALQPSPDLDESEG